MAAGVMVKQVSLSNDYPTLGGQNNPMAYKKATSPTSPRLLPNSFVSLFRKPGRNSAQDIPKKSPSPTRPSRPIASSPPKSPGKDSAKNGTKSGSDTDKKKSFYRKPVTRPRTVSTTRANFDNGSRRHMFSHHLRMWNSEPDDIHSTSDTSDKDDDEAADDITGLEFRRQTLDTTHLGRDLNPETSFRPRAKSMPAVANSILKKSGRGFASNQLMRNNSRKQFCFNEEVDVFYFDKTGKPNGKKSKDLERLKSEMILRDSGNWPDTSPPNNGHLPKIQISPSPESSSSSVNGLVLHKEVKMVPYVDSKGCQKQKLRIRIKTDESCIKDRTSVKALSGGSAIIVMLYKNQTKDGGTSAVHQHVERLPLPVIVDPYKVKAHLHKTGELEIDAPLKEETDAIISI